MNEIDPSSVPSVVAPASLESLGDDVVALASSLETTMASAHDRWQFLQEVFDVSGAEGAIAMLDPARNATTEFAMALTEARRVLSEASTYTLPALQVRRETLIERINEVNRRHEEALSAVREASTAYWAQLNSDPDSDAIAYARESRQIAMDEEQAAQTALDDVRGEIERFRADVETEEGWIAAELGRISGGDIVRGAWGEEVRVSQTYWGRAEPAYPGGPIDESGLAENLRESISDAVVNRINRLAVGNETQAREWIAAHPDFASVIGFVDPERASRLFEALQAESSRGEDGSWAVGPLATLFATAPSAIGNLNGIPASAKNEFNRKALRDLIAQPLTEDQRAQLEGLEEALVDFVKQGDEPALLTLFLDSTDDGSPRASVAFGDVDTADQITTLTHGIETDTGNFREWGDSATNLKLDVDDILIRNGSDATTATVVFFEWESGETGNVWGIERPDGGAERLAQIQRGLEMVNPSAQLNLAPHSLGTTMAIQMIVDNPGLIDNAWLFGSAGITEQAASQLGEMIQNGEITVRATHATDDFVAAWGRTDFFSSEHPVDPRTLPGVEEFSSDGGPVPGFSDIPDENVGLRTEGHNSQASTEWFYTIEGIGLVDTPKGPVPSILYDDEAVGYLDPRAQAFRQMVVDLARAADSTTEPR